MDLNVFQAYRIALSAGQTVRANKLLGDIIMGEKSLIEKCVGRFRSHDDKDELRQLGAIGVMEAVKRFDLTRSSNWSAFARQWILGEMERGIRQGNPGLVRIDKEKRKHPLRKEAKHMAQVVRALTGREATASELGVAQEVLDVNNAPSPVSFGSEVEGRAPECECETILSKAVLKALQVLTVPEHRVFLAKVAQDKSNKELAYEEDMCEENLRVMYLRSLDKVREALRSFSENCVT